MTLLVALELMTDVIGNQHDGSGRNVPATVAVIGGTGHVGAALCQFLTARGNQVVSVSRSDRPAFDDPGIERFRVDVLARSMGPLPTKAHSAIICPWVQDAGDFAPGSWIDRLVTGLVESGTRSVVYLSTMWVYGDSPTGLLTESTRVGTTNPYGAAHAANEVAVESSAQSLGIDVTIFRMANLVGPDPFFGDREKISFAHELMEMAVTERRIVLRSPASTPRNMLPRTLFHHDIEPFLDRQPVEGRVEIYNVGGRSTSTMMDLAVRTARIAEQHHGHMVEIAHPVESTPRPGFHLDTSKIRSLAGPGMDDLIGELSMVLQDVVACATGTSVEGARK